MAETNYKFPLVDDEGKLFDKFPLIILYLSSGDTVELNYFTEFAAGYRPTRYMVGDEFIPKVEYHSYFISPQWTCKEFLRHASDRLNEKQVLQTSNDEFTLMNNVCKIKIIEQGGDIICFGKGTWVNKSFYSEETPHVADAHDIVLKKKEEPMKIDGKKVVDDFMNSLLKNE